jgi:hypothetical protein
MIPNTFDQWKSCIINNCKINLTKDFARQRLAVYTDRNNTQTKEFLKLYGEQHLQNIMTWFKQIQST